MRVPNPNGASSEVWCLKPPTHGKCMINTTYEVCMSVLFELDMPRLKYRSNSPRTLRAASRPDLYAAPRLQSRIQGCCVRQ